MWKRLRQITGGLWLAFGGTFLAIDAFELPHREFAMGRSYYVTVWGYFTFCILGGALLLTGIVRAKWLVTALAALLAIYALGIWGKAGGAPLIFQLWCAAMVIFSVWSIVIVQRRNA